MAIFSYEVNLICNHCQNECVTGAPMGNPKDGRQAARDTAVHEGWRENPEKPGYWICKKCLEHTVKIMTGENSPDIWLPRSMA